MDFGFAVPTRGPLGTPEDITAIAQQGEALGFGHILVNDHIVVPRDIDSTYPYTENGDWPGGRFGEAMDQLTVLAFLASATKRVRLLASVMVVPHRSPVATAKMLTTIDLLSNGRLTVGCGAGWMEEEFEALNTPPFAERGKVTDDYIDIFKELWTQDEPSHDGPYAQFSNIAFEPKTVQNPHPPIWIGGESGPALRRSVQRGDAWYPCGYNPRFPMDTVDRFDLGLDRLRAVLDKHGRDPASLTVAYNVNWYTGPGDATISDGARRIFTGSEEDIRSDAHALKARGVKHLMVNLQSLTMAETSDRIAHFAAEIMPAGGA